MVSIAFTLSTILRSFVPKVALEFNLRNQKDSAPNVVRVWYVCRASGWKLSKISIDTT